MARRQLFHLAAALVLLATAASVASAQSATPNERPQWLLPMHVTTITMQALDAHSTYAALHHANVVEANPLMKGLAERPVALVAVKAGVAAAIVYSTETLARRHPAMALLTGVAVNSAYAMLVARNYSIARQRSVSTPR